MPKRLRVKKVGIQRCSQTISMKIMAIIDGVEVESGGGSEGGLASAFA